MPQWNTLSTHKMGKMQKRMIISRFGEGVEEQNGTATLEKFTQVYHKVKPRLKCNFLANHAYKVSVQPTYSIPRNLPKRTWNARLRMHVMFRVALFIIAQTGSNPNIHQTVNGNTKCALSILCNAPWQSDGLKYRIKAIMWRNLESIMPNERSQTVYTRTPFLQDSGKGNTRVTERSVAAWGCSRGDCLARAQGSFFQCRNVHPLCCSGHTTAYISRYSSHGTLKRTGFYCIALVSWFSRTLLLFP